MTRVCLQHVDATRNMRRFYIMDVQPTLFGEWCLVRENGRIGSPGRVREEAFASQVDAEAKLARLKREKQRKGYQ